MYHAVTCGEARLLPAYWFFEDKSCAALLYYSVVYTTKHVRSFDLHVLGPHNRDLSPYNIWFVVGTDAALFLGPCLANLQVREERFCVPRGT